MSALVFNLMTNTNNLEVKARAGIAPLSGFVYTTGVSDLNPNIIRIISREISKCADITHTTKTVYFDLGSIHRKIVAGDTLPMTLDGTAYSFRIVGFNHDPLSVAGAYGEVTATEKAGITWHLCETWSETYPMISEEAIYLRGDWSISDMRTVYLPQIKAVFSKKWQDIFMSVIKYSYCGEEIVTEDVLFIPATIEILGEIQSDNKITYTQEGEQYAWYRDGNKFLNEKVWARSVYDGHLGYFSTPNYYKGTSQAIWPADKNLFSFMFCT